ncbi:transmembrane protein 238 like [Vanacampus margaritifer]
MDLRRFVGKCLPLLFVGLALDVVGLTLLLVGVFANVRASDGQFYGDFFIFTGALVIFISLGFWVMWYAGNVRVRPGDARETRTDGLAARIVRKLSERLSRKMATAAASASTLDDARAHDDQSAGDSRPHQASRVTWGKATAYNNKETLPHNYNYQGYRQENYNKGYDNQGYDHEIDDKKEKYDKGCDSDARNHENSNDGKYNHYNNKEERYDSKDCDGGMDCDVKDKGEQL